MTLKQIEKKAKIAMGDGTPKFSPEWIALAKTEWEELARITLDLVSMVREGDNLFKSDAANYEVYLLKEAWERKKERLKIESDKP